MIRALCLVSLLALGGCGLTPVAIVSIIGAGFTITKDVIGIDISLSQTDPTKTPVSAVLPTVPALLP